MARPRLPWLHVRACPSLTWPNLMSQSERKQLQWCWSFYPAHSYQSDTYVQKSVPRLAISATAASHRTRSMQSLQNSLKHASMRTVKKCHACGQATWRAVLLQLGLLLRYTPQTLRSNAQPSEASLSVSGGQHERAHQEVLVGERERRDLTGTRESAHPIHRYSGLCVLASLENTSLWEATFSRHFLKTPSTLVPNCGRSARGGPHVAMLMASPLSCGQGCLALCRAQTLPDAEHWCSTARTNACMRTCSGR